MWPLIRVCVRLGLVPRMLTRSFSSKPPEPPDCELMVTPGTRCSASATFLSGILPMSSAVMTSTTRVGMRAWSSSDFSSEARMPVTVDGLELSSWPCAAPAAPALCNAAPQQGERDGGCDGCLLDFHCLLPRMDADRCTIATCTIVPILLPL